MLTPDLECARTLAFGAPAHDEPAFARARNEIFRWLVARGWRAIAVEGPLDRPADRDLVAWIEKNRLELNPRRPSGKLFVAGSNRHVLGVGADAVIVGSLGASVALGLGPPAPGTFEGRLGAAVGHGPLFPEAQGGRTRVSTVGYTPLDAETVERADAIWHVDRFPAGAAALADRIRRLPDVAHQQAGPEDNVPDLAWDDCFFFVGDDRKHPFATIVSHDLPGFDDESRLDRAGVFRLNLDLGRKTFTEVFGYGPEDLKGRRHTIDFAAFGQLMPHPVYGVQSWASIVNPGSDEDVDRLLGHAHRRHGHSRNGA